MMTAAGLMAKSKIPELGKYLRWFGLATAGLMALTSILGIILTAVGVIPDGLWSAIYTLIICPFVFLWQYPVAMVMRPLPQIIQKNFYIRTLAYIVLSICTFFNRATIISGVALILLGLGYAVAGFRGETAPDIPNEGASRMPDAGGQTPAGEPAKPSLKDRMSAGVKDLSSKLDNMV